MKFIKSLQTKKSVRVERVMATALRLLATLFLMDNAQSVDQSVTLTPSANSSSGVSIQSLSKWVSTNSNGWSMDADSEWTKGFDIAITLDSSWSFSTSSNTTFSLTINGPHQTGSGDRDLIISFNDPLNNHWFSTLIALDHTHNNAMYPSCGEDLKSDDINNHIGELFDDLCCDLSPSMYEIGIPFTITIVNDPESEAVNIDIDGVQSCVYGSGFEGGNPLEIYLSINAVVDSPITIDSLQFDYHSESEPAPSSTTSVERVCDASICAHGDDNITISVSYDDGSVWEQIASSTNWHQTAEATIIDITEPTSLQFKVDDDAHTGGFLANVQLTCDDGYSRSFYTDEGNTMFDVVYSLEGEYEMGIAISFGNTHPDSPESLQCMHANSVWIWNGLGSDNVIFELDLFGDYPTADSTTVPSVNPTANPTIDPTVLSVTYPVSIPTIPPLSRTTTTPVADGIVDETDIDPSSAGIRVCTLSSSRNVSGLNINSLFTLSFSGDMVLGTDPNNWNGQTYYRLITLVLITLFTTITVSSCIDAKCIARRRNDFYRTGPLIAAMFQCLDLFSDIFFCIEMLAMSMMYLFIASAVFIVFPVALSMFQLFVAVQHWRSLGKDTLTAWFRNYAFWLYALSLMTGSAFSGTQICRSDMFGLPQFAMPLNENQIVGFQSKKLWTTVMLEVECFIEFKSVFPESF